MPDMSHEIGDCVMIDADVVGPDHYVFASHRESALLENRYICRVVEYIRGIWRILAEYQWQAVAVLASSKEPLRVEILGRDGQVGTVAGSAVTETQIDSRRPVGPFRGLSFLGEEVFAYGMKREVFVREKNGTWIRNNPGMETVLPTQKLSISEQIKLKTKNIGGINAMTVDSSGQLIAVGMRGEIWLREEERWLKIESPTNLMLKDAVLCADDYVYVCGQVGTILRGFGNRWEPLTYEGPQELDLSSICCFRGLIYVADGHSLRLLNRGELEVVDFGVGDIVPCATVVSNSQRILSVAGQEVWHSDDGSTWSRLLG